MWEIGHVSRTIPLAFYFTIRKRSIGKRRKGNNNNKKKRGKWKECQKRGWRHGDPKYDAIDVTNNGIPNAANGGGEWKGGKKEGGSTSTSTNFISNRIKWMGPNLTRMQCGIRTTPDTTSHRWTAVVLQLVLRWFYEQPLSDRFICLFIFVASAAAGNFHWFNALVLRHPYGFLNICGAFGFVF